MHPVARVFQILFLVAGLFMFLVSFSVSRPHGTSWYCETQAKPEAIPPHQEQRCDGGGTNNNDLVDALIGVGLMIGSASITVGGRRTPRTDASAAPVAPLQPYAAQQFPPQQFPAQQGQPPAPPQAQPQPPVPPQAQAQPQAQAFQGTPPQPPQNF